MYDYRFKTEPVMNDILFRKCVVNCISASQEFLREHKNNYATSLRNIDRFLNVLL